MYLILSYNQLTGAVPREIGQLSQLFDVELHNNYLTSLPSEIRNLKRLASLSMGFNHLQGSIPRGLGVMSALRGLFLENNKLTGTIPDDLYTLENLLQLELDHNLLSGQLPESLAWMPNLETLHLNDNQFQGDVPAFTASNLTSMVSLFLQGNSFTSLPQSLEDYACQVGRNASEPISAMLERDRFVRLFARSSPCLVKYCALSCF